MGSERPAPNANPDPTSAALPVHVLSAEEMPAEGLAAPEQTQRPQAFPLSIPKAAACSLFILVFGVVALVTSAVMFRNASVWVQHLGPHVFMLLAVAALIHFVLVRYARISPAELGLVVTVRTLQRLGLGLAIGTGLLLVAFMIAWGGGHFVVSAAEPESAASWLSALREFARFLIAALFEELLFRVALVGVLRRAMPASFAVTLPAALFGLAHVLNPNSSTLGIVNTVIAGILLGLLYLERGARGRPALGLAVGVHTAWNFSMAMLGISVSGHRLSKALLETHAEDALWSGGSYGLEAGLGTLIVLGAASVVAARFADLRAPVRTAPDGEDASVLE